MHKLKAKGARTSIAAGILMLSIVLWFFPSHVVELIAENRHVLLGRYGVTRFSVFLGLTPILWMASYAVWASGKVSGKEISFRLGALMLSVMVSSLVVDLAARLARQPRYIERQVQFRKHWPGERVQGVVRHRPANRLYKIQYTDAPPTARSYPDAPPGYPTVDITLKTDERGYRNRSSFDQYDVVVVGDSFTEGSRVSDDQSWPALLEEKLNCSVYNLGISGGEPNYYLSVFRAFGLDLKPKIAIFMIYEGNDFKGIRFADGTAADAEPPVERIVEAVKASPVVSGLKKAFINYLGHVNADGPVKNADLISWMPVAIPAGRRAQYYAFRPGRLMRLDWSATDFMQSQNWTSTARLLKAIKKVCEEEGIRLVFAYAPSKPHVIMPLVWNRVPAEKLHAFAAFKKRRLPSPEILKQRLMENIETQETVLRDFCRNEGIEFVSATQALREAANDGRQVYYTYDQHWTSLGHAVVSDVLISHLVSSPEGRISCPPPSAFSQQR